MDRLLVEWYDIKEVFRTLKRWIGQGASLKEALIMMFKKDSLYRVDDGPMIKGSYYDYIRHGYGRGKGV